MIITTEQKLEVLKLATQLTVAQLTVNISAEDVKVVNFSGNLQDNFDTMKKMLLQ